MNNMEKQAITKELLHNKTLKDVEIEWNKLKCLTVYKPNTMVGNLICDFFTLDERLNTIGIKGCNFYQFYSNIDLYREKWQSIDNIIRWCDANRRYMDSHVRRAKFIYNLYFGAISTFSPIRTMEVLDRWQPKIALLDPCMGWGGRLIGSCVKNIPQYIGLDTNTNLIQPYISLVDFLKERTQTRIKLDFCDCLKYDYSTIRYDMVLTSPPYFDIEVYRDMPKYMDWEMQFYIPFFRITFENLENGGVYIVNIPDKIYEIAKKVLGECNERIPFLKRSRGNGYVEYLYVWFKQLP
jgi:hypothetical protein